MLIAAKLYKHYLYKHLYLYKLPNFIMQDIKELVDGPIYDHQLPMLSSQYLQCDTKYICKHRMKYSPIIADIYVADLYMPGLFPIKDDFITNFIIEGSDIEEVQLCVGEYTIDTQKYSKDMHLSCVTFEPFKNGFYLKALEKDFIYMMIVCNGPPTVSYTAYKLKPDISKILYNNPIYYSKEIIHYNIEGNYVIENGVCKFAELKKPEETTYDDACDTSKTMVLYRQKRPSIDYTNMNLMVEIGYIHGMYNSNARNVWDILTGAMSGLLYAP